MKRILIITLEYPPQVGGIATYTHQIAQNLDPNQVVLYAPVMKNTKDWDERQKYKIIRKKPLFPVFVWPRWLRMFFQIRKIVKQEKIEVIIINHILPVGYVCWLIKKFLGIPYIVISHGTDVLYGSRNTWKVNMMRKVVEKSEQIIFNSVSLRYRFLIVLPEFESKSSVMYPCPDPDFLEEPPKEKIDKLRSQLALEGKRVLLSVGRLDEGKGFPHIIRTLPKLLKRDPHVVWVIIGDGPKKQEILNMIQKKSLQNVVRYIGEVPYEDLKIYYYLADLFVLLTHPDEGREEGLGMVFLEAAAAGLPVVAGKSGGVEEAVLHTKTGIVVDVFQEARQIESIIFDLLSNHIFALQLGKNAKERIRQDFQWPKQLKKLEPWIGDVK